MFNWEQSTYTLIIGIATGAVLVLPFTGKIYDGRRKLIGKIRQRGWYTIIAFGISVSLGVDKDKQAKKDQSADKSRDSIQRLKNDSINHRFTEESNAKIVNTFATSLAKYGLKYDSAQMIIEKLVKDSSKRTIQIIQRSNPKIEITSIKVDSIKNGNYFLKILLECSSDAAYNIRLKCYTIYKYKNGNYVFIKGTFENIFNLGDEAIAGGIITPFVTLHPSLPIRDILIFVKGTYENQTKQSFTYSDIVGYDFDFNVFGRMPDSTSKKIVKDLFAKNGIK